ncbi:MAG TPA: TonB-dependent receptor [Saprospiraceae bacterium]|nr:TonB-dependent receptor [Saprospiraceae bacterium]HMP13975.1 TonB-dependent receptor [Saprospiraceae bacterium]
MKKLLSLLLFFSCGFGTLSAQQPPVSGGFPGGAQRGPSITGKITGVLIDSTTNAPVEFATVVLIQSKTGKQLDGVITDEKGAFRLQDVRTGEYELHFSFLGYRARVLKGVELTGKKPDFDAGKVLLAPEGLTLAEVQVTGQAAIIENRIDKLVYNAEKDVTSMGGDAADVLQKVPLLSVDAEGNVSLRGSSNVQILINGKPSTIFSSNPGDALRSIPADQIKSVEVITAPTAKFDGEGSGGIINIITKKKSAQGFTGSIGGSIGNRTNRGNANFNLARGRFGMNFSGSGWYNPNRPSYTDFFRTDQTSAGLRTLQQRSDGDSQFFGPRGSLGMYYDINAYNSFSSAVNIRGFGRNQDNLTTATFIDPQAALNQLYTRNSVSKSLRSGVDWTADYKRTFKKPEKELSFGVQLDMDFSTSENRFDQDGNDETLRLRNVNENLGRNWESTFQVDYVQPISKGIKLETGVKSILRQIDSDFSYDEFDFNRGQFVRNLAASDFFVYNQDVYSGYASLNVKLGKRYGAVVGARYEHTDIRGDFDRTEITFANSYGNLLPSLILSRSFKNFSNLRLSYNQRIQRPGLRFVNPYVDISDPRDVSVGNPELRPEVTHQTELNYGALIKSVVVNASLFYRYTSDGIESFLEVTEEGISRSTFRNIGENQSVGLSFFSSINIKEKLTLRAGGNFSSFQSQATIGGQRLSRSAFVWNGNMNATLTLKKGWKVEAFGFYNAPRQTLQGFRASFSMFNAGVVREFNKQFSMGLNVTQPFMRDMRFRNELEGPGFYQNSLNAVATRSFGVNANYRFGKLDFKERNRQRGRNNDLKSDDDGSGMGGGPR